MKKELISALERAKNYSLAVAEALPPSSYQFKPADGTWSFGELMHHMAYSLEWMNDNYLTGKKSDWNPPTASMKKDDVKRYLQRGFETVHKTLQAHPADENFVNGFITTMEHNAHHRGQATTYLRCNGIVPPEYPF